MGPERGPIPFYFFAPATRAQAEALQHGHGPGVQSIAVFCKEHGAVCRFTQEEGWFCLQLVL